MIESSFLIFFLLGTTAGCGALFLSFELISKNIHKNFRESYQKYERNDLWQKKTSHGSTKTPSK